MTEQPPFQPPPPPDVLRQEVRGVMLPTTIGGTTYYSEQSFGILINETKGTETELFRNPPNLRWGATKEQLIAEYAVTKMRCEPEDVVMYEGFIASLEEA